MHFKRWWCWHFHLLSIYGAYEGTTCDQSNSHSGIQSITFRCLQNPLWQGSFQVKTWWRRIATTNTNRRGRSGRGQLILVNIDFNNYCCKDTNTKYKKEEGGVGSWCQEAQHNGIALIQARNTDTRWETLIQGEAHWYKDELWYNEVRSYQKGPLIYSISMI